MKPDSTAVRTALWRALHTMIDVPPHVIEDSIGKALAEPEEGWQARGDMHPIGTRPFRASIVGRARFIEDLVASSGVSQYVLLGAGLDSFAQRQTGNVRVFEIDQPGPQAWKKRRLEELGLTMPSLVPVDFEKGESWPEQLVAAGFDRSKPSLVASAGVSMYLTREANIETLRSVAQLAEKTTFVMTFLVPLDMAGPVARPGLEMSSKGAAASGTPFVSYFAPSEIVELARAAGFAKAEHVSSVEITNRYFANRPDGMCPPVMGEEILVAYSEN